MSGLTGRLRLVGTCALLAPTGALTAQPVRSTRTEIIAIQVHEGTALAFDLSPDGRTIVFDLLGQLWQLPSEGGVARPLTNAVRDTAEDLDPSYSTTGSIVFRGERRGRTGLWLIQAGRAPLQLTQLDNPNGYDGNAAWSPDGKRIVFARLLFPDSATPRPRTRLYWLDLSTRETGELVIPQEVGPVLRQAAWEPQGRRLAVVTGFAGSPRGGALWLVEPGTARATRLLLGTAVMAPAFSPDGRRVAFFALDSAQRAQVWVTSIDSAGIAAPPLRLTSQVDVTPTRVRWTPDGSRVVYSADGRLWSIAVTGGAPVEIPFTVSLSFQRPRRALPPARFPEPGKPQSVRAFMGLALSPDARSIAMLALGTLWVMPIGGTPRAVTEVPVSAHHLAWSPDGSAVAWSAGAAREENLFATVLATGATRQLTALRGREEYPAYSPDGRHLAFLHQPAEDTTFLRIVDPSAVALSDPAKSQAFPAGRSAEPVWSPENELLHLSGGFAPDDPSRGHLVRLSGGQSDLTRVPDSPLFLQWVGGAVVFVRHARLWRAPFDSTGLRAAPVPLGASPAMYSSVSRDGTILYLSTGGLRLRLPDGREQRLGWPLSYTPGAAPSILIRNARIIDGTGAPATTPRDLLIEGGRIRRIGPAGTLAAGTAQPLDAAGRYLIPGLMDLHAHEYAPELLPSFAYFGVTAIRDQGSAMGPLVSYADAIAAGKLPGPRVDYGGFQFYSDWAYDADDQQGIEPEADPHHVARAVEVAAAFGSLHIKTRTFRRWDINARMITEAHRRGMRVTGHCSHLLPLVAAGIDAKEHAGFCTPRSDRAIYDDLVQLYRAAGIAVVPTITYSSFAVKLSEHPDLLEGDTALTPFLPPKSSFAWMLRLDSLGRKQFGEFASWARQAALKLARAGVTIGTGTDIWQIPTGVHQELEELVAAGLSPLEAIRAATGNAARVIGAEAELGTIEQGKWADLIILDADPVADIRNTRRIWAVLQAGKVLDRAALRASLRRP